MNELEKTLSTILEKALKIAEQTGEYAIEQAPILLQEFYHWNIARRLIYILIGVVVYIILRKFSNYFGKKEPYTYSYKRYGEKHNIVYDLHLGRYFNPENGWQFGRYAFRYGSFIVFFIILTSNLYHLLFILVAPKLYLIEYFIQ